MDNLLQEVGSVIARLRVQKGMSQPELAKSIGLSLSTISRIEAGRADLSVVRLGGICKALNITLSEFFDNKFRETNALPRRTLGEDILELMTELHSAGLTPIHRADILEAFIIKYSYGHKAFNQALADLSNPRYYKHYLPKMMSPPLVRINRGIYDIAEVK